jgi:hypothetical protein
VIYWQDINIHHIFIFLLYSNFQLFMYHHWSDLKDGVVASVRGLINLIPILYSHDPTVVSEMMVRRMTRPTPCIESVIDKSCQMVFAVECSGNDSASIWMKKLLLEGEHNELNDSHLRRRILLQVWDELSLILFRKVKVKHFISKKTHKFNSLKLS